VPLPRSGVLFSALLAPAVSRGRSWRKTQQAEGHPAPAPSKADNARVIDELINVADFERAAAEELDADVAGYFFGGAGDELTLRENVAAWSGWRLRPRALVGLGEWSAGVELLGGDVSMPVLVAPTAYQGLIDPEGEVAMARAAAAAGTVMCLSTCATTRPGPVAAAAPDGRHWFQLYCFKDEGLTRALVDEAVEAGSEAIVVTVDAPRSGNRERDLRTGFKIPEGLGVPSVEAALGSDRAVTIEETFGLMEPALSWSDFEELAADCRVPVLVKGVQTGEDAVLAVEHGAAGVVVSNHGARQLDRCLATADVLPEAVDAVAGRIPVLVDGGIRRGVDVAIALALGADAVLVGRPTLWGLAVGGEAGARRVLELLREELELTLALCGCASPAELTRAHVQRAPAASVYSD
jgi:isopentenyl diphosphate isomerase/L-lactate dehydrogenase-like FMN-dependent dehydrogenase